MFPRRVKVWGNKQKPILDVISNIVLLELNRGMNCQFSGSAVGPKVFHGSDAVPSLVSSGGFPTERQCLEVVVHGSRNIASLWAAGRGGRACNHI